MSPEAPSYGPAHEKNDTGAFLANNEKELMSGSELCNDIEIARPQKELSSKNETGIVLQSSSY